MALVLENVTYNERPYARCVCSCGQTFHAYAADFAQGEVMSCGHKFAGNTLSLLEQRRFPKGTPTTEP